LYHIQITVITPRAYVLALTDVKLGTLLPESAGNNV
jgi:hypothetical protein